MWAVVYRKELRETLRDRRTLAVMILLPLVLYPLMSVMAAEWFISHETERQARAAQVIVTGPGRELRAVQDALRVEGAGISVRVEGGLAADPKQGAAALGGADAVVVVPEGADKALGEDASLEITLLYDPSSDDSSLAAERVSAALGKLGEQELARRLEDEGLTPAFVTPVAITQKSVATRTKVGRAEAAKTLPFVIVLMVLMGAFYPAIDLTAGEKERGTLEPLLATPAPRRAIMVGKLCTVATISALTGLLNLLCMIGAGLWIARSAAMARHASVPWGALASAVPWGALGLGLLALLVATLAFAGLMMAVASLARSFKEAQNFLTPLYLVASMPAMASWLPGTELSYGAALLPIANVTLLLKGAVAGTLAIGPVIVALAATIAYAAAAVALAARVYDSERLLFSAEAAPDGRGLWARWFGGRADAAGEARSEEGSDEPLPAAEAMGVATVCVLIFLVFGVALQARGTGGVAASLWLCFALPVLSWVRARRGQVRGPLGLGAPRAADLVGAALIGVSFWIVLAAVVLPLQERIFPTPKALQESLESLVAPRESILMTLFAVAITPAVCEELLCRGVVARGLERSLGMLGAVIGSAIVFAVLHMSAYRFVPTFLIGLVLGAVALRARTLWPAMIIHACNNGAVVLLSTAEGQPVATWLEQNPWSTGVAVALLGAGFALVLRPNRAVR